jgi:hypothetical protein
VRVLAGVALGCVLGCVLGLCLLGRSCAIGTLIATCVECPAPSWRFGIEENSDACKFPPKHDVGVP